MKVTNIINTNGNAVKNQFVIQDNGKTFFQSYNSLICIINHCENTITFGRDWDYSRTTIKHLDTFLRENIYGVVIGVKVIRQSIETGKLPTKWCEYTVKYDSELM